MNPILYIFIAFLTAIAIYALISYQDGPQHNDEIAVISTIMGFFWVATIPVLVVFVMGFVFSFGVKRLGNFILSKIKAKK